MPARLSSVQSTSWYRIAWRPRPRSVRAYSHADRPGAGPEKVRSTVPQRDLLISGGHVVTLHPGIGDLAQDELRLPISVHPGMARFPGAVATLDKPGPPG